MSAPPVQADLWPAPRPTGPVRRVISLPGSKSQTNRAVLLAALADGPSRITHPLRSRDTLLMTAALRSLGTTILDDGDDWRVEPGPWTRDAVVDCGLAGTVMRFVPPVAGLSTGSVQFDGDDHMRTRPVGPVLDAIRHVGVTVDDDGRGALPFTVRGSGHVRGGAVTIDASASSQFVSALLLAGARFADGVDVHHVGAPVPSLPHVDMTVAMLREHGVAVDESEADRWTVAPGPITALDRTIEPDLSNAGAFLGFAATTESTVTVRDWPSHTTQAGDALRAILSRMGCAVTLDDDGLTVTGPSRLQGVDLDLHDVGELTPVVAALCALADTPSRLRGVAHIRAHETDRLAALTAELTGLGADVTEHEDGLTIVPAPLHGGVFHTYADHRMAHAAVIIGAATPDVVVENVTTTAKTFPDFAGAWTNLVEGGA